jgi:hypothetical protein
MIRKNETKSETTHQHRATAMEIMRMKKRRINSLCFQNASQNHTNPANFFFTLTRFKRCLSTQHVVCLCKNFRLPLIVSLKNAFAAVGLTLSYTRMPRNWQPLTFDRYPESDILYINSVESELETLSDSKLGPKRSFCWRGCLTTPICSKCHLMRTLTSSIVILFRSPFRIVRPRGGYNSQLSLNAYRTDSVRRHRQCRK